MVKTVATWALAAVGLSPCFAGCAQQDCTADARFGLLVTVTDGAGQTMCDAMVTATDGGHTETLGPNPSQCTFVGALERRGTYTLAATIAGRSATVDGVRVLADDCHVIPAQVTITI